MTRIKPRTASLTIYQGDDLAALADLRMAAEVERRKNEQAREDAEERARESEKSEARAGDDEVVGTFEVCTDAQDAYDAFVDEAAERAVVVTVRLIGRKRFADLCDAHPARMVTQTVEPTEAEPVPQSREVPHEDDEGFGVNVSPEAFPTALLTLRDDDVHTIIEPEFKNAADLRDFLDNEISDGDFATLWMMAYSLNRSGSLDPKATRYGASLSGTATSR